MPRDHDALYRAIKKGGASAAEPRDGGPAVTAASPRGLHARDCRSAPLLGRAKDAVMRGGDTANRPGGDTAGFFCDQKKFASPDCAVGSITRAIPRNAERGRRDFIFRHARQNVRDVMLDANMPHIFQFACKFRREIIGV